MVKKGEKFNCQLCGKETVKRTNGVQKYCGECSQKKDLERKRKWAKEHPISNDYLRKRSKIKRVEISKKGIDISNKERESIFWSSNEQIGTNTLVRVAVPFMYRISKNSVWSTTSKGHVFLRNEHRELRDLIILKIKRACSDITFYEDKIWLDIFVQKPDHRGDAVNVIDAVCDAVKRAINVDDRWFSIKRLDWQITKENPMIFIGISQASEGHKRVCSICGRILPLEMFWKDRSDRLGVGRECKDCVTKMLRKSRNSAPLNGKGK